MNAVFSILLLAAILGFIVFLLAKQDKGRRSQYGPSGLSEFRTDLPLDDCFDRLDQHSPDDVSPTSAAGRTTAASPST